VRQLSLIGLVLVAPARGLGRLAQAPEPRAALMVGLLVGCLWAAHAAVQARVDPAAVERRVSAQLARAEGGPGESGGERELSEEKISQEARQRLNLQRIAGYAGRALGAPLGVLAAGILFWLLSGGFRLARGFRRGLRLMAHAGLPLAVRQLLAVPVALSYPGIDPDLPDGLFRTDLGAWLGLPGPGLLDPFWLWTGLLAGLACRALGRGRLHSVLVGLVFWGLAALALGPLGP
jgi:hypothetical protein